MSYFREGCSSRFRSWFYSIRHLSSRYGSGFFGIHVLLRLTLVCSSKGPMGM